MQIIYDALYSQTVGMGVRVGVKVAEGVVVVVIVAEGVPVAGTGVRVAVGVVPSGRLLLTTIPVLPELVKLTNGEFCQRLEYQLSEIRIFSMWPPRDV